MTARTQTAASPGGMDAPANTRPSFELLERVAARAASAGGQHVGREMLAAAVRRAALARGDQETARALIDVAAAAAAWAAILTGEVERDLADVAQAIGGET